MEIPLPLALLTALPVFVSLTLLPIAFLLPNCPCCDVCTIDVPQEVFVSYNASWQFSGEYFGQEILYQTAPFPEHWFSPVVYNSNNRDGFFFFSPPPEREEIASIDIRNQGDWSVAASGQVACIYVGEGFETVLPDGTPSSTVLAAHRFVHNADYVGVGCAAEGVDVEVRTTCPGQGSENSRWSVICYWCAGEDRQTITHGNAATPTSPRIPSSGQRQRQAVSVLPGDFQVQSGLFGGGSVPLFPDFPFEEGWTHFVKVDELTQEASGSGSSASLVPDFPAVHEGLTETTYEIVHRVAGLFSCDFDFVGQAPQSVSGTARFSFQGSGVQKYLLDAAATLEDGRFVLYLNPCNRDDCPILGEPSSLGLQASSFANSAFDNYATNVAGSIAFFEVGTPSEEHGMEGYLLLKVATGGQFTGTAISGTSSPASAARSGTITLEFE